jgi:hypothetical protein
MQKLIAILITSVVLLSCSKSGTDKFIGTWQNAGMKNLTVTISRHEGGSGYTINEKIYYAAEPADKQLGWSGHPTSTDTKTFSGIPDGDSINVTLGMGFVTPMEMKNNQLYFDTGRSCDNCKLFNKVN